MHHVVLYCVLSTYAGLLAGILLTSLLAMGKSSEQKAGGVVDLRVFQNNALKGPGFSRAGAKPKDLGL